MKSQRLFSLILGLSLLMLPRLGSTAELTEIIKRGKLIVAVKDNVRPLGFYGQGGELQGLEIDIAKRLAAELLGDAAALELVPVSNRERLPLILEGKVDLAIAQIAATPERNRLVDFSPHYYLDGTGIVTKNPQVGKAADLVGQKIAVLEGSTAIAHIRSELRQVQLVGVKSYQEALCLLEAGQVDAFAGDNSILAGWVQEYPGYHQLPLRWGAAPLAVAMPKGLQYKDLYEKVTRAMGSWRDSGWLQQRAKYWGFLQPD